MRFKLILTLFLSSIISGIALSEESVSLENNFIKMVCQPDKNYMFKLYDAKSGTLLLSHQTLEMPSGITKNQYLYEYNVKNTGKTERFSGEDYTGLKFTQDWPLFEVEKNVILKKNTPSLTLRYFLKAKQNFTFEKSFNVMNYFYAGNEADRIGWQTPAGIKWEVAIPRKVIFGTTCEGSDSGRFAVLRQGENGTAFIFTIPCKAQRKNFNIWRYEIPSKSNPDKSSVAFKSNMLTLKKSIKKGDLFVIECQLDLSQNEDIGKAINNIFSKYKDKRAETASGKSTASVPVLSEKPVIDGNLNDPAWKKASSLSGFILPHGGFTKNTTEVKMFSAGGNLYLGFKCTDNDISKIKKEYKEHDDPLWLNDSIEIFLASDDGSTKYFHYICNPIGTKFEEKCDNWGEGQVTHDSSWNENWNVTAALDEKNNLWVAEVEIPLSSIGINPEYGSKFRLNLARVHHKESSSCWAPTYGGFHDVKKLGTGIFGKDSESLLITDLQEGKDGHFCDFEVSNNSSTARNLEIKLIASDCDSFDGYIFNERLDLKPGESKKIKLNYEFLLMERVKNKLILSISENDKILESREFPLVNILGNRELGGFRYDIKGGTSFWTLYPDNKVFKSDELIEMKGGIPPITLDAAKGEMESFQLVIKSPGIHDWKLAASELKTQDYSILPENIKIYRQRYVTTRTVSDSYGFCEDWPDPLMKENIITSVPGKNNPVWITVKVPRDAKAGTYSGFISVLEKDKEIIQIPYLLKIWNFSLPEKFSQIFWSPDPGIFRDEYNMDTHFGFNSEPKLTNGKIVIPEFETENFKRKIELARKIKSRYIRICSFHVGSGPPASDFLNTKAGTPEYYARVKEYLQMVYDELKKYGLEKNLCFYIYDEPTLKEIPVIKEIGKIVRSISPDIIIYGAIYINCWNNMDDETRNLIDAWWMPYENYTPEFLEWAGKNKKTLMAGFNCGSQYPYPSLFIDAPILAPRVTPWINWKYGIDVITTWHTFHSVHSKDPYVNPATFSHYNGEGVLIYPSGPNLQKPWNVTSIRVEMLREGMEDFEYIKMLKSLIDTEKVAKLKENAEAVLKEAEQLVKNARTYDRNAENYRLMKSKLGNMIEEVLKKRGSDK